MENQNYALTVTFNTQIIRYPYNILYPSKYITILQQIGAKENGRVIVAVVE